MSTDLHVLYMQVHAHIILCYICRSMSTDLHILYMQVHAHIFYSIYVGPCPQTYMYCIRRSMPTISLLQAGSMMSGPMSEIGPSLRSTLAKTESTRHYKRRSCAKCTFPRPLLLHYKVIPFASLARAAGGGTSPADIGCCVSGKLQASVYGIRRSVSLLPPCYRSST